MKLVSGPTSAIDQVVSEARRRRLIALAVEEACRACAVVCLLFAVLLVTGAGVFHPAWILVPLLAAAIWTAWRVWRRRPGPYGVAQAADARLGLRDLLATAWSLQHGFVRPTPLAPLIEERAEQACAGADVPSAFPLWQWSRPAVAALAALLTALSLFVIRVGILRTFELRAPLVAVHFDTLTGAPVPPRPQPRAAPKKLAFEGFQLLENLAAAQEEPFPTEALRTVDAQDPAAPTPEALRQTGSSRSRSQGEAAESTSEDARQPEGAEPDNEAEGSSHAGSPRDRTPSPPKQDSLLDRMRDALANLIDKFRLELPPGEGTTTAAKNSPKQDAARREKGQPQPGKKGEPAQDGQMQAGQQQASNSGQQSRSDQAGRPDANSPNEKSGVGREEGRKELELAEQLEAMGKLDELIGKRGQNVQGEMMVEVTHSSNQSLRTPYVQRIGNRTDAGTELGRDEVPLHLQPYVQRYYEQVRRGPQSGKGR